MSTLFKPMKVGNHTLKHRIVLAPLTRCRADLELRPTSMVAEYYRQRATDGGLLITEATIVAEQSISLNTIPGIFNEGQAKKWKEVVDAVHEKGCKISMQLWHQGKCAHYSYTEHPLAKKVGAIVCESASPVKCPGTAKSITGAMEEHKEAREMTLEDIERVKRQFVQGAKYAVEVAGFDFVEIHGAHSYLVDQFLNSGSNCRTDKYGGSIENRMRFLLELTRDLIAAVGEHRVAVRFSPHNNTNGFSGVYDDNPDELYRSVFTAMNEFELAYVLVTEPRWDRTYSGDVASDPATTLPCFSLNKYVSLYTKGPLIGCGGFTPLTAYNHFTTPEGEKKYDGIAFGRWYISNPDLVFRVQHKLPLNRYVRATFYATDSVGYTDYPTFEEVVQRTIGGSVNDVLGNDAKLQQIIKMTQDWDYPLVGFEELGGKTSSSQ